MDVRVDAYGMLAAHPIAPLVSLHHLDYVKPINPNKPSQVESLQSLFSAYWVDPARILQQAFCYDVGAGSVLSVSVAWGYTVQVYSRAVAPRDLETPLQTFKTWHFTNGPFIFNTRPLGDPCARPFVFFLDKVLHNLTDATFTAYPRDNTTTYPHPQDKDEAEAVSKCNKPGFLTASRIETVKVFAPKMDAFLWKQAPQRHCCSVQRTELGRMLEVQIKHCSPGEPGMPSIST